MLRCPKCGSTGRFLFTDHMHIEIDGGEDGSVVSVEFDDICDPNTILECAECDNREQVENLREADRKYQIRQQVPEEPHDNVVRTEYVAGLEKRIKELEKLVEAIRGRAFVTEVPVEEKAEVKAIPFKASGTKVEKADASRVTSLIGTGNGSSEAWLKYYNGVKCTGVRFVPNSLLWFANHSVIPKVVSVGITADAPIDQKKMSLVEQHAACCQSVGQMVVSVPHSDIENEDDDTPYRILEELGDFHLICTFEDGTELSINKCFVSYYKHKCFHDGNIDCVVDFWHNGLERTSIEKGDSK